MIQKKNKSLGLKIQTLRKDLGLSQEHFAGKCGISVNYLSLLENGHKKPGYKLIHVIAKNLNTTKVNLLELPLEEYLKKLEMPAEIKDKFQSLLKLMGADKYILENI